MEVEARMASKIAALSTSKKNEHGAKASMEKRERKATDGDGEVTMKTLERKKKCNGAKMFACKRAYGCKTWYGMHTPGNSPVKSGDRPR